MKKAEVQILTPCGNVMGNGRRVERYTTEVIA